MMGSGKSTVGKKLAKKLGWKFIDLDSEIEMQTGKSINEIFDEDGEDTFRKLEKMEFEKTAETTNTVIATGGGIILSDETRKRLQELGEVVYLDVDINTLENRLRDKMDRPLLQTGKSLKNIFDERVSFYTQTASLSVDGSNAVEECVQSIISGLK